VKNGQLRRQVERGTTRLVNDDAILGNGRDHIRVDEVVNQATGRRLVDVCPVDAGGVTVLAEQRFLELFVVGTRVVVRIRDQP